MILPQFSLRFILAGMTVLAFLALIVSYGLQGSGWAVGIAFGLLSGLIILIAHALMFGVAWCFSLVRDLRETSRERTARLTAPQGRSPFATRPLVVPSPPPSNVDG